MTRKEAIERIRSRYDKWALDDKDLEAIQCTFPELFEGEDERIRQEIVSYLNQFREEGLRGVDITPWISYLEKQKEPPFVKDVVPGYPGLYFYDGEKMHFQGNPAMEENPYDFAMSQQEKQKEQKPVTKDGQQECPYKDLALVKDFFGKYKRKCKLSNKACDSKECEQWNELQAEFKRINEAFENGKNEVINRPEVFGLQKPAEWSEDYREEDIQTRFAFYTYKDDPSVLYLSNVFVEEASRNHGFGTRILKAAEKVAEAIGAISIRLKVKQDSLANAWYRNRGYGYFTFEGEYDWLEKTLEYLKPSKSAEWSEVELEFRGEKVKVKRPFYRDDKGHGYSTTEQDEDVAWYALRAWCEKKGVSLYDLYQREEWSEEDDKMQFFINQFLECHEASDPTAKSCKDWLNSRLKFLRPQPHWKPSDKQMGALKNARYMMSQSGDYYDTAQILDFLIDDLKKLIK